MSHILFCWLKVTHEIFLFYFFALSHAVSITAQCECGRPFLCLTPFRQMASASIIQWYLANNQGSGDIYPPPAPLTVATHSAWWHSWWGKGQCIEFANYIQLNTTGSPFLIGNSLQDPRVEADLNRKCAGVGHLVDLLRSLSPEEFPLLKRSKPACSPEHWQVITHMVKIQCTHCLPARAFWKMYQCPCSIHHK